MASINKLNHTQVKSATEVGLLSDGGGLYLQISSVGTKSWLLRFKLLGKRREMGLGSYRDVSLAEAREKAAENRKLVKKNIDPIEQRKSSQKALAKLAEGKKTFKECALEYIASMEAGWKHPKHSQQWKNSLINYVYPVFGDWPIDQVDREAIQKVLTPIWNTKTETAGRIRGRIERILDWARVKEYRSGENPAYWRGNLEHLYTKPSKIMDVKHMPSLPYEKMASFLLSLKKKESLAARAVELLIYTVTRPTEALSAKWSELDLEARTWTIPKDKMKGNIEHVIPLSDQCADMLENLHQFEDSAFLFPSTKKDKHLSSSAMLKLIKTIGEEIEFPDITAHGFRASFKTWTSDTQNFDWQAVEFCLAHKIKDKAAAAYHRSNLLEKRKVIMSAWANHCVEYDADNVVSIQVHTRE
jgi:integrase